MRKLVLIALIGHANNDIFRWRKGIDRNVASCVNSHLVFIELKRRLEREGHRVATIDMHDLAEADQIVFCDAWPLEPHFKEFKRRRKTLHARTSLFLIEPPITNDFSHRRSTHKLFDRVLTFDPTFVDNKRCFRYHYPENVLTKAPLPVTFRKKKFLCLLGANKYSIDERELYSERKRAALFFEQTKEGIDVYGPDWNGRRLLRYPFLHVCYRWRSALRQILRGVLRRLRYVAEVAFNTHPLSKRALRGYSPLEPVAIMSQYRFSLCFENGAVPGYASERLYDSMNARCVPIYLGDTEILKQVPPECYIDMRKFKTYEELYAYLRSIDERRYAQYLRAIGTYLKSAEGKPYSVTHFCEEFYQKLIKE